MENQTEPKWYQKPTIVIILLIIIAVLIAWTYVVQMDIVV
tara:strand:- start:96 stop:215 length:120 start_codon:yes stop_codon:yes gene_type:complete